MLIFVLTLIKYQAAEAPAFTQEFPIADVGYCYFHYRQAIRNNFSNIRLKTYFWLTIVVDFSIEGGGQ